MSVEPCLPRKPHKTSHAELDILRSMTAQSARSMLHRLCAKVSGAGGSTQILQELLILRGSTLFPGRE
jgi:hypothetical protein